MKIISTKFRSTRFDGSPLETSRHTGKNIDREMGTDAHRHMHVHRNGVINLSSANAILQKR